jgi:hypothetical protein
MRLAVTGPRDWKDARLVYWALKALRDAQIERGDPVEVLIHGKAPGLDALADACARGLGITVLPFPADWRRYHRPGRPNPAGAIRNRQMLTEGEPSHLLAFHTKPEAELLSLKHSGTADMVRAARSVGVPYVLIREANDLARLAGGLP